MTLYTIGFAGKMASEFFGIIRDAGIKLVVDVRLRNTSQLAGFTKRGDLPFFLREICGAGYQHEPLLVPTADLVDGFKKRGLRWDDYERQYLALLADRRVEEQLDAGQFAGPTALLCAEASPDHCHRRLAAEYLAAKRGELTIVHL